MIQINLLPSSTPDKKALMEKHTFLKQNNFFQKNSVSEGKKKKKRIFLSHYNCSFLYNVFG